MISTLAQLATVLAQGGGNGGGNMMIIVIGLVIAMLVFSVMSSRGRKKQQQREREKLMNDLQKNARIISYGGIVGVVTDVKDDEVILKVDEASNTKIRMKKWAIRNIVPREGEGGGEGK